jgi:hypothetical protein
MNEFWKKLSKRERTLATFTSIALVGGLAWIAGLVATRNLAALDETIDGRQMELVNYRQQLLRQHPVDQAFSRIASQHSSKWTTEEIRDGLHKELYRLALRTPPAPDAMTASKGGDAPRLVTIPSLPDGLINASGKGYREYAIDFRIQPAPFKDLIAFLSRLEESPQVLRIDGLELNRDPESSAVSASVRVTRTVVDGIGSEKIDEPIVPAVNIAKHGNFEDGTLPTPSGPDWFAMACDLAFDPSNVFEGQNTLRATATQADARLVHAIDLELGRTYRMTFSAAAQGDVVVGFAGFASGDASTATIIGQPQALTADGMAYTYTFQFSPASQSPPRFGAPMFLLKAPGTVIYVDNVEISLVGG